MYVLVSGFIMCIGLYEVIGMMYPIVVYQMSNEVNCECVEGLVMCICDFVGVLSVMAAQRWLFNNLFPQVLMVSVWKCANEKYRDNAKGSLA